MNSLVVYVLYTFFLASLLWRIWRQSKTTTTMSHALTGLVELSVAVFVAYLLPWDEKLPIYLWWLFAAAAATLVAVLVYKSPASRESIPATSAAKR